MSWGVGFTKEDSTSPNRFDHLGFLTVYLVNKCSNNRLPWLPRLWNPYMVPLPGILMKGWEQFSAARYSKLKPTYVSGFYAPSPKSDPGQSTPVLNQQQVRGSSLGLWVSGALLQAFVSLLPCPEADGTAGIVRQIPPSLSGSHMGHMCLHLSSKPMCPSLPHPCPTSFLFLFKEKP